MWNYCKECRVQWHSRGLVTKCDVCHTADPLQSETGKIEGRDAYI